MNPLGIERSDLVRDRAYIDGEWIAAPQSFPVADPATGATIRNVADCGAVEAAHAVDAAERAFGPWKSLLAKERARRLRNWFDLCVRHGEDLAKLMSWEQGKPLAEARAEIAYGSGYIEWFSEEAKRAYGDIIPTPVHGRELFALKEPVGIAAIITPWNFPNAMIARKFGPALAAGCTVVAKPAAETPLSALALAVLAQEAGIPKGVLNLVTTSRAADISAVWLADPRVRKLSFTGSTAVGKLLARQSADTLKRLSLELGGDAPLIVFDDADIETALSGLMKAKFRNAGQTCVAANRIYIQANIHDTFVEKLIQAVGKLTIGAASDGPADIGPLIHEEAARGVAALVDDAVSHGARVLIGGKRHARGGAFYEPTVLTGVSPAMKISCKEVFGPVVPVVRFNSEEELVALANGTPYGLAAYVFTSDPKRMWRMARALESGIVGINEGVISTEVAPFGGVKESGYGREGSKYGLADYMNVKYVCLGGLS
jgi:succinate-semialdehyde dehydrogenase/glutarate-semialdehyde dehydrogenase